MGFSVHFSGVTRGTNAGCERGLQQQVELRLMSANIRLGGGGGGLSSCPWPPLTGKKERVCARVCVFFPRCSLALC